MQADYEVQGLFDPDFKFSVFGKPKAPVARRSLIETPFSAITFPLVAGKFA